MGPGGRFVVPYPACTTARCQVWGRRTPVTACDLGLYRLGQEGARSVTERAQKVRLWGARKGDGVLAPAPGPQLGSRRPSITLAGE